MDAGLTNGRPQGATGPITEALAAAHARILAARVQAGCTREVRLLAVSKTFPAEAVLAAAVAGQTAFGENYVQEGVDKIVACRAAGRADLTWHFIGPLQSNKTRPVAEHFDWVESVDRERVARRLSEQRPPELPALQVCLQVNVSGEDSKSGCAPHEVAALAAQVAALPRLELRGIMGIPAPTEDVAAQRAAFARLRACLEEARAALRAAGLDDRRLDTLSMGMSADLEAAILEGATQVRVGSAIFGARAART